MIPKRRDYLRFVVLFLPLRRSHKTRSKITTATSFSRQNGPGSLARYSVSIGKPRSRRTYTCTVLNSNGLYLLKVINLVLKVPITLK